MGVPLERLWESSVLSGVEIGPQDLAVRVAAELRRPAPDVVEVIRLRLEALDLAIRLQSPGLLADQLRWQQARLRGSDFGLAPSRIDEALRAVLADHLGMDARRVIRRMDLRAERWRQDPRRLVVPTPLPDGLARDYVTAALKGGREAALAVIRGAIDSGFALERLITEVLVPAQAELGRLWEKGVITVAHEHYVTALTELSLALFYAEVPAPQPASGAPVVTACVGRERHELGVRMLSDLLRRDGWNAVCLGGHVPWEDLVEAVAERRAAVLAVSVTMTGHLRDLMRLVEQLRAERRCARVKLLVGGRPFDLDHGVAPRVGADAMARDAFAGVRRCREWLNTASAGSPVVTN